MKTSIILIAILGCSLAESSIDWSNIKPKYAYVEPVSDPLQPVVPRVVGGQEAEPNSKPYIVALIIDGSSFCGGSLISRSYVLSAGHCLEGTAYIQIILGAHDITQSEPTQIIVTSTRITIHPDFNPENLNNDVAIVALPTPIVLNNNVQVIPLAPATSGSFVDANAVLAGWGRLSDSSTSVSSTLHQVDLIVMANYWCQRIYGANVIISSTLCTSGVGTVGGCDGDSGSPLVVDGVQVGIASFVAYSGCESNFPTGYARITSFLSWIRENSDIL